jgi:thiol:disulfide interchange protein DsbD
MTRLILLLALLFAAPAVAQEDGPKVMARLVAEGQAAPGGKVTIALEEKIAPHWHTYWINPGDAGAPTTITWSVPQGWTAGAIQWPRPMRVPFGPLMDYGYEGKLWLLSDIAVPADAKPGETVTLKAQVSWLVCRDVCIPEDATLSIPVTIASSSDSKSGVDAGVARDFAEARALLPVASPWKMTYALGQNLDLYVAAPGLAAAHPVEADFFPLKSGIIKGIAPQVMGFADGGLVLRLTPDDKAKNGGPLDGVLVLKSGDGSVQALNVSAPPGPVPAATFAAASAAGESDVTLGLSLLFAFLGGLILNVMPCVLPILAMKALALARHHDGGARAESFAYALGAVVTFALFGVAIVLLRQAGTEVGWGFQLQEPLAVAGFALLMFAVGLNLSGLFEVGTVTAGESLTQKGGATGAFFTGVLAVAVAAPCTAPFMAVALGFALTQGVTNALAVFIALGLGFALPFLLLGVWPGALSFLPRPGPWMLRLKQFMAFPMYAAAAWMVWVLAIGTGPTGVAAILAAMVALALALWLWSVTRDLSGGGRVASIVAALLIALAGLAGLSLLRTASAPAQAAAKSVGEPYTAAKLAQLRAANTPVFVDATAAWCITCLVNEEAVLSKPPVKDAFAAKKVVYMVADWTNRNDEITRLLKENGRSGVPMYLYYGPGAAKPVILPQILTQSGVLQAIGG